MLRSCNDRFFRIAVFNGEHPCPPAFAKNRSRKPVEPAVRHTFLDTGVHNDVNLLSNLELLDDGGNRAAARVLSNLS